MTKVILYITGIVPGSVTIEAEYTYAEMRKKYKGNLFNNQLFDWINTGTWVWLCIAIMVIGCVVAIIVGKKKAG